MAAGVVLAPQCTWVGGVELQIPFRNIMEIDDMGDEYYGSSPHLYCKFADYGAPYEDIAYRSTGKGYQPALDLEKRFAFKDRRRT